MKRTIILTVMAIMGISLFCNAGFLDSISSALDDTSNFITTTTKGKAIQLTEAKFNQMKQDADDNPINAELKYRDKRCYNLLEF